MAASQQRVICVDIERVESAAVEQTPEERLEAICQHLQKAEAALENGDIQGFFDNFKKAVVKKVTGVYNRVQDLKPTYKVELPTRFYDEMDAIVKKLGPSTTGPDDPSAPPLPVLPYAPSYPPQPYTPQYPPQPYAPSYPPQPYAPSYVPDPSAPDYPANARAAHAGQPMYYLVRSEP